jgi:hypothetical protein
MFNRTTRKKIRRVLNQLRVLREDAMSDYMDNGGTTDWMEELEHLRKRLDRLKWQIDRALELGYDGTNELFTLDHKACVTAGQIKRLKQAIEKQLKSPSGISGMTREALKKGGFLDNSDYLDADDFARDKNFRREEEEDDDDDVTLLGAEDDDNYLRNNGYYDNLYGTDER